MSIPTLLPNGEQVFLDDDGNPLVGGKVYFFVPQTTIPKTTWQDAAQQVPNSNPVILDSAGRAIIYGNGVYRQKVTDALDNLIWDQLTASTNQTGVFVGGQSAGSANAQTLVLPDYTLSVGNLVMFASGFTNSGPTTLNIEGTGAVPVTFLSGGVQVPLAGGEMSAGAFTMVFYDGTEYQLVGSIGSSSSSSFGTGDTKWRPFNGTQSGWVRLNGNTIGSAASAATELASIATQSLYLLMWDSFSNAQCPVSGGRGATAQDDFNANKTITLLDLRGRSQIGLDQMGAAAPAARFTGVPFVIGDATTPGSIAGENTHVLVTAELAAHTHAVTDPGHTHTYQRAITSNAQKPLSSGTAPFDNYDGPATDPAVTGITIANAGSDDAHNTVQQSMLGTWYMKL